MDNNVSTINREAISFRESLLRGHLSGIIPLIFFIVICFIVIVTGGAALIGDMLGKASLVGLFESYFFGFFIGTIVLMIILHLFSKRISIVLIHKSIDFIIQSNKEISEASSGKTSFDILIKTIKRIHKFIKTYYYLYGIVLFLNPNISADIDKKFLENETYFIHKQLLLLKEGLIEYFMTQKSMLGMAKSSLGEVSGRLEFTKASELQSARLDRQIEQFEELQRVLVKM